MSGKQIARLHLIGPLSVVKPAAFVGIAVRAASGGCGAVHLRIPNFRGGDALRMAESLKRELSAYPNTRVFVNDRLDVALLAGADGVQLGERSVEVREARRIIGGNTIIGRSIHDAGGAKQAEAEGADFLLAGHIYETPSKEGEPGRGLDWLAKVVSVVNIPVIAIGGITVDRVPEVIATGAHGIAMGREILEAADPAETARRVVRHMESAGGTDAGNDTDDHD